MSKNGGHINYEELIAKYLAEECNQAEVQLLEKWVQENQDNRKLFIQQKRAWQLAHNPNNITDQFDTDKAWDQMEKELFGSEKEPIKNKTININSYYRIAAAIAAMFAIGYFVFYLVLLNGNQTLLASNTPLTETLADGTQVTLNRNSTLTFPKTFEKNERRVELEGDAFFDVTKDPQKPFIIQSGEISVEVLGTSFYVNAKSDEATIKVTVKTGKVAVYSGEENKVELLAGDIGVYDKQDKVLSKSLNKDVNFLSWKTKKLLFQNTSLDEVFTKVEETYQIKIHVSNPQILSCRWTASFDNQPLETVLNTLKETFDLEIKQNGKEFSLGGLGCN